MNPESGKYNNNEQLEKDEIENTLSMNNHTVFNAEITQEEEDQLTQEKLRADADQEVEDLKELDASFGERE